MSARAPIHPLLMHTEEAIPALHSFLFLSLTQLSSPRPHTASLPHRENNLSEPFHVTLVVPRKPNCQTDDQHHHIAGTRRHHTKSGSQPIGIPINDTYLPAQAPMKRGREGRQTCEALEPFSCKIFDGCSAALGLLELSRSPAVKVVIVIVISHSNLATTPKNIHLSSAQGL